MTTDKHSPQSSATGATPSAAYGREWKERSQMIASVIKPVPSPVYTCDYEMKRALPALSELSLEYGRPLDLTPDYQRGHVWTSDQQSAFILALLRGVLPESAMVIQFNCANWDNLFRKPTADLPNGLQCLDGLQRITAVQRFLDGEITVGGFTAADLEGTSFSLGRGRFRFRLNMFSYTSREQILEHYLAFNAGGTPHPKEEIDRVKMLLEQSRQSSNKPRGLGL